jgi:hypothetical protein
MSPADRSLEAIRNRLTPGVFLDFHRAREREQNEADGYGDTRNVPDHTPTATHHSPHWMLSCSRKVYYTATNAPAESEDPHGIFKIGHLLETYLEDFLETVVAPDDATVRNVVQIEFEVDGLTFSGSTDPVLFTAADEPLLLTEVKTTKNLYYIQRDGAKHSHKAQAHVYAKGLQQKYGLTSPPPITIIYIDRNTLETAFLDVEFDAEFWQDILQWATKNSGYRDAGILPPPLKATDGDTDDDPTWLCGVCEYAGRCKEGYDQDGPRVSQDVQHPTADTRATGFLPLTRYPEDAVISHLATYPDVPLTPTVASQYPDLIDDGTEPSDRLEALFGAAPQREVADWHCPDCEATSAYGTFDWDGDLSSLPTCPRCDSSDSLHGPRPRDLSPRVGALNEVNGEAVSE